MNFLITDALAASSAAAGQPAAGSSLASILMMVGLLVVFYFLLWRPQSKRAKEHRDLIGGLQAGDEVVTSGGMLGKISKIEESYLIISVSQGVELTVQKGAVSTVLPKGTLKSI